MLSTGQQLHGDAALSYIRSCDPQLLDEIERAKGAAEGLLGGLRVIVTATELGVRARVEAQSSGDGDQDFERLVNWNERFDSDAVALGIRS